MALFEDIGDERIEVEVLKYQVAELRKEAKRKDEVIDVLRNRPRNDAKKIRVFGLIKGILHTKVCVEPEAILHRIRIMIDMVEEDA